MQVPQLQNNSSSINTNKISRAKSYKSKKIIKVKLTFYRRRQNEQNKVGAESATTDHVGGKRGPDVNLTSGCRRPLENVWCLSSLMIG